LRAGEATLSRLNIKGGILLNKLPLRKADLVFSVVLMGISILVIIQSIKLFFNPFGRPPENIQADETQALIDEWATSPALVPLILAAFLMLCAVLLMINALREGARLNISIHAIREKMTLLRNNREIYVLAIIIGLLMGYVLLFIPLCRANLNIFPRFQGFPFMVATFIFMFAMTAIFNEKTVRKMVMSFLVAAIASGLIAYGFGIIAMIPLP
jgi:hypothetical protein